MSVRRVVATLLPRVPHRPQDVLRVVVVVVAVGDAAALLLLLLQLLLLLLYVFVACYADASDVDDERR